MWRKVFRNDLRPNIIFLVFRAVEISSFDLTVSFSLDELPESERV